VSPNPLLELDGLAKELDAMRERLAAAVGPALEPVVDRALEGLRASVEQLRVAEEELRAQNDELEATQLALEVERARLASLFEDAPDTYIVTDGRGMILHANRMSERLFGRPSVFLEGKPLAAVVSIQDRHAFRTFAARATREPVDPLVARVARRDEVVLWAEFHVTTATHPAGPDELRWVIRDVTDQVQAERSLWELNAELESRVAARTADLDAERAQLAALLRQLPVGVVILDAKATRIEAANAVAVDLLGPDVATAARFGDALKTIRSETGEPLSHRELPAAMAAQTGEPVAPSRYHLHGDGDPLVVEMSAGPVRGEDGAVESVVLIVDDVTERDRRERADREFVSNAAHQLRTPLTAIASAVAVLQGGAKDIPAERDRFLAHLERETGRLSRLGRALLTLARAQRGESEPELEIVDVASLLETLSNEVPAVEGIELVIECAPEVGALANPELLEEALENLVANAVKYTQSGRVGLRASTAGRTTVIEVADSGPGIAPELQLRVFERFFRARDGDATGFGLGLPIARAAVEAMHGSVEIVPAQGEGTTIRVSVPAARLVR
jgi:two-component system phosphate regulon sensor histidine kinase PhoR